jgi:hypothetical protein
VFHYDGQLCALAAAGSGDLSVLLLETPAAAAVDGAGAGASALRLRPLLSSACAPAADGGGGVSAGCSGGSGTALLLAGGGGGGGGTRGWAQQVRLAEPAAGNAALSLRAAFPACAARARPSAAALCASSALAALGDARGCLALHALARPDAPLWTGALAGGTGPRVADLAFWPGSEHTLLAAWCVIARALHGWPARVRARISPRRNAVNMTRTPSPAPRSSAPFSSDDRVLICDTRAASSGAGGSAAEPPAVRAACGAVAPPRAHAARALALAFPSAHDPWLVCVGGDDGAIFAADLRRPAAPLAVLAAVHDGPVWRLCAGGDAAAALLSAGDDGALRATPMRDLRGVAAAGAAANPREAALLLQTAHPLRCVAAGASSAAGAAAVAGDDTGRLHAVRLLKGAA